MGRKYSIFQVQIPDGEILDYPDWYYESRQALRGRCLACAKPTSGRKRFCCQRPTTASRAQVSSLRKAVHMAFGFACAKCGFTFEMKFESGYRVPRFWGEVDHKVPLCDGGPDEWENLQLLCGGCHSTKTANEAAKRDRRRK